MKKTLLIFILLITLLLCSCNHKDYNVYAMENSLVQAKEKLPSNVQKMLEKWSIVIDDTPPYDCLEAADGATFYERHVIWIKTTADTTQLLFHETGHAVDHHVGYVSRSEEFVNLYKTYWNVYETPSNQDKKHMICDQSEFFASTFADTFLYTEYMQEKYPDIYEYFMDIVFNKWSSLEVGTIGQLWNNCSITYEYTTLADHRINVSEKPLININAYLFESDFSYLDSHIQEVVAKIISSNSEENEIFTQNVTWTKNDYDHLNSWIAMYFGDESLDFVDVSSGINTTKITIKHSLIAIADENREKSLTRVEKILSELKDGTDKEKLIQISEYLIARKNYAHFADSSFNAFWDEKYSGSTSMAMVFKQFADRLGVKNDIVYTVTQFGEVSKVYNRVYIDGVPYYYNLMLNMVHSPNLDVIVYYENNWNFI